MNNCVQLDLFNTITPVAVFDWHYEPNRKIFEYSDDIQFDDSMLIDHYIIDVPVYKFDDLIKIFGGTDKSDYWALVKNKQLNHCIVRITDKDRYGAGDKWFVLANAKTKKFVQQHAICAILKGTIKKAPKLYKKVVKIDGIDYRDDMKGNFVTVYTLNKWSSEHILKQIN